MKQTHKQENEGPLDGTMWREELSQLPAAGHARPDYQAGQSGRADLLALPASAVADIHTQLLAT